MRTTLTLDPDVAAKARKGAAKLGKSFKEVINAALRVGLDQLPPAPKPYRTKPRPLGLRQGFNYDLRWRRHASGFKAGSTSHVSTYCIPLNCTGVFFQQLLQAGGATGNLVTDAHLAAVALEHNCELCSTDHDFARFPGLKWRNPLA